MYEGLFALDTYKVAERLRHLRKNKWKTPRKQRKID